METEAALTATGPVIFETLIDRIFETYVSTYQPGHNIDLRPSKIPNYDYAIHSSMFDRPLEEVRTKLIYDPSWFTIDVLDPYLNIRVESGILAYQVLTGIHRDRSNYPVCSRKDPEQIIVEHTSANPTGRLHIGRSRNSFIGDTLARVYRKLNYQTTVEYYINDLGKQAVLAHEAYLRDPTVNLLEDFSKHYAAINQEYQTDQSFRLLIDQQLETMETYGPHLRGYQQTFRHLIDVMIISELRTFRVCFDQFESELDVVYRDQTNQVQRLLDTPEFQPLLERDPGGYIALKEKIHGRSIVLRKTGGASLYLTRDLVYNIDRLGRATECVTILGEDTKTHNEALRMILCSLGYPHSNTPVYYNFVILAEGKMSTRRQNVVTLHDLYVRVIEKLRTLDRTAHLNEQMISSLAVSFIRLAILSKSNTRTVVFEFDRIFNPSAPESSFYPFYTYARMMSIIRRQPLIVPVFELSKQTLTPIVRQLVRQMYRYRSVLEEVLQTKQPNRLTNFLEQLCVHLNQLYDQQRIIGTSNEQELLTVVTAALHLMDSIENCLGLEFFSEI